MLSGSYYKKIVNYQFDAESKRPYVWDTTCQLEQDELTLKGELKPQLLFIYKTLRAAPSLILLKKIIDNGRRMR
ncbi:MAG: hypothetical protein PHO01_07375 [Desulfotomaculaceae bacterium]|nr:hypothetical protein [Desulfotomaculaceae bacterium]